MQIIISGQDRTSDLGRDIRQAGHYLRHGDPAKALTPELRLMAWQQTHSQPDFQAWLERVLACGTGSETVALSPQQRPNRLHVLLLRIHVMARKLQKGWLHGTRPPEVGSEIGVLTLRDATSESDYTSRLIQLMKYRDNIDSNPFLMPRSPGRVGAVMARFRIMLWRLMRFQVDRIAFRQNHINTMLTRALEFEHEQRKRETDALQRRVTELESRLKSAP